MNDEPRISVLMPVHNPDPRYLRAALESVVGQTFRAWEMVVVEEPPAGCTREVIASLDDARIRYRLRSDRTRLCDTLNEGLALCRADLVARMDADDVMEPKRLELQLAHLDRHPDVTVLGTAVRIIDEDDVVIGRRDMPCSWPAVASAMRRYNALTHPTAMFRRDTILAVGGYGPVRAEDYDLWCRLVKNGSSIENLPERLLRYRYHTKSVKFATVHEMIRETIATKVRHFDGAFTVRDRLRMLSERVLLMLPPKVVLRMFRMLEY